MAKVRYKHYKEVAEALKAFGYTEKTIDNIFIADINLNHARVWIGRHMQNGLCMQSEYIGTYDFVKHTFVD